MALPALLLSASTIVFLVWERIRPGRELPHSKGWYLRALSLNLIQLLITLGTVRLWTQLFGTHSIFVLSVWGSSALQGAVTWFVGTFFFYWWHRLRHASGWWLAFHQVHHSPSRIEILTSFYKHPLEIFCDSLLSALVIYPVLGCPLPAALWYNFFAGTGEYFYHANIRTPAWLRYLIQTPELHSVHHQFDLHSHNFGDIPLWDRLFGTYRDSVGFAARCGFPVGAEQRLLSMLAFRDVYVGEALPESHPQPDAPASCITMTSAHPLSGSGYALAWLTGCRGSC